MSLTWETSASLSSAVECTTTSRRDWYRRGITRQTWLAWKKTPWMRVIAAYGATLASHRRALDSCANRLDLQG